MYKHVDIWSNWLQHRWMVTYDTVICDHWLFIQYHWQRHCIDS